MPTTVSPGSCSCASANPPRRHASRRRAIPGEHQVGSATVHVPRGTGGLPACLVSSGLSKVPTSTSSPRRAHAEPTPSPRQVHVQATDELRNAAWCCPRRQQPRRLGGWAAGMLARATGTESEILHAGMRTPPRTHIRLGQAAKKSGTSMFSGPRASLLAGIELTSSDVRRVWLPLLRGFRTSASGRTTDGWLDVWCLPGDLYRHASGGAEKTRIVVRVDAVKRDGIVRRSGHLVHTRLVLSLVQFKVLTHIGITSWRRGHRCETAYAASSCQGDAYCIMCLKHHLSTKVLFHNSPYAA